MATEPNATFLSDERVPRITFSGKEWPIPKLCPAQLEIVAPVFASTGTAVTRERMKDITTVVFTGLYRAHKTLTRQEFDEMPTDFGELAAAFLVVGRQAGILKDPTAKEANGTLPLAEMPTPVTGAV